jgi:hypothetical protein
MVLPLARFDVGQRRRSTWRDGMIVFRDRMARGTTRTDWHESRHTFSFGG